MYIRCIFLCIVVLQQGVALGENAQFLKLPVERSAGWPQNRCHLEATPLKQRNDNHQRPGEGGKLSFPAQSSELRHFRMHRVCGYRSQSSPHRRQPKRLVISAFSGSSSAALPSQSHRIPSSTPGTPRSHLSRPISHIAAAPPSKPAAQISPPDPGTLARKR